MKILKANGYPIANINASTIVGALSFKIYIYTISDPITGLVRYVGKTKDPNNRFKKHLTSNKLNTKSCRWIKGLKSKGLKPVFDIIDTCSESDWQQKERQYI